MKSLFTLTFVATFIWMGNQSFALNYSPNKNLHKMGLVSNQISEKDDFSSFNFTTSDKQSCTLKWILKNEQNPNTYFNIQKSTDGTHFSSIAKIQSTTTSNEYQYDDASETNTSLVYYRIVEVYEGDVMTQSPVLAVKR